ncbi:MAG: antibiotic biosynthesis monooxygenase family protein [Planctomycetota bacterium]
MVTIGMNYAVIQGKEQTFESAFNKVLKAMQGIGGHGETQMYRDINNPQQYLIVSLWTDKAAFDAFIGSETFKSVANWGKEQILSGRPRHEVYGGNEPAAARCPAHAG